jgi:outer membrane protein insertion porin family
MTAVLLSFIFINNITYAKDTQNIDNNIIKKVTITGNKYVEEKKILDMIEVKPGEMLDEEKIDKSIRNIYKLGYFDNIIVSGKRIDDGIEIIFSVEERPIVLSIEITGSKEPKHEEIKKRITLKENAPYQIYQLKRSVQDILAYCRNEGYYFAEVTYKVEEKEISPDRKGVNITFYIDAKQLVKIRDVIFVNNTIPAKKLRRQIKSLKGSVYNEQELELDIQRLIYYYKSKGYLQIDIPKPKIEYSEEKEGMIITIEINEGEKFTIESINITGNKLISEEELRARMKTEEDTLYNIRQLSQDIQNIIDLYASMGYISCQVIPQEEIDIEDNSVTISLYIDEGEQAYIEQIIITGNTKTKENVIRRELLVTEGSLFDGEKVKISRQRLINLGYFDEVNFKIKPGSEQNKKILEINVKEGKTGTLLFSAGYGSVPGIFGSIECTFHNLKGKGYSLNLKGEIGKRAITYEFGFTNPWFMDKKPKTLVGVESWHTKDILDDYTNVRRGGSLRVSREISVHNLLSLRYKYEEVSMRDVKENASESIKEWQKEWGERFVTTSSMNIKFLRDTKMGDDRFNPDSGYLLNISNELVGGILGGDIAYCKPTIEISWYVPSWWRFVLALHLRCGIITKLKPDKKLPDYEKFRVGGHYSVRGYEERSICPTTIEKTSYIDDTGNKVVKYIEKREGGEAVLVANIEYRFPISPNQLYGILFFDCGNVWEKIYGDNGIDFSELKYSAGFGVRINSPIGPIRLDYAWRLSDMGMQKKGETKLHFSIGSIF